MIAELYYAELLGQFDTELQKKVTTVDEEKGTFSP